VDFDGGQLGADQLVISHLDLSPLVQVSWATR
jgi:hypothetical protein